MAKLRKEEITRKLLHFISGTILPLGIFYLPKYAGSLGWKYAPWTLPVAILAVCLLFFMVVEYIRFRVPFIQKIVLFFIGSMMRVEEAKKPTGATYINAAGLVCAIIFKDHPAISCMVLSTFIWSDAVAALVGQSIGRIKIGKKSLEGSLACFVMSMILYYAAFPFVPGLYDAFGNKVPLVFAVVGSLCVTVFELIPLRISSRITINDNLSAPVLTGLVLLFIYPG